MRPPNQLIPILAGERDSLAVSQLYPNLFPFLETSREKVGAAIRYDSINLSQQQQQRQRIATKPEKQRVHDPLISRAPTPCPPGDPAEPRSPPRRGRPRVLGPPPPHSTVPTESRCRRLSRPNPVSRGPTEPSATPPAQPPANVCLMLPLTFRFRTSPAARAYRRRPGWPTFHPPRQAPLNSLRRGAVCGPPR